MNDYLHLIQLSEIDWQKHSIVCEMDTTDDGRILKKEFELLLQKESQLDHALHKMNINLEEMKYEESKAQTEKQKMDSQLFSIGTTPKIIYDIQIRLEKLKKFLDELETKELELMDQIELVNKELTDIRDDLYIKRCEYEKTIENFKRITLKGEQRLAELETQREQIKSIIDKTNLTLYEKLLVQKSGIAMVEITNNECQGCHQTVSVALLQALKEYQEELHFCNNCGRIVYLRRTIA